MTNDSNYQVSFRTKLQSALLIAALVMEKFDFPRYHSDIKDNQILIRDGNSDLKMIVRPSQDSIQYDVVFLSEELFLWCENNFAKLSIELSKIMRD